LLAEIQEFVTGVHPASEVDRILATGLFVDIVGSTERAVAVGDVRWRDLMDRGSCISQRVSNYDQCSLNIRMI
jgi:class 3 adenylate cyclase